MPIPATTSPSEPTPEVKQAYLRLFHAIVGQPAPACG